MAAMVKPRFTQGQAALVENRKAVLYGLGMPNGPAFKSYLLPHLKRLGMTQEAFAEHFNYSKAAVTGWFKTGKVSKHTIKKMATLLNVPREEIEAVLEGENVREIHTSGQTGAASATPIHNLAAPQLRQLGSEYARLIEKLTAAVDSGLLGPRQLEMLEGAIDSQLKRRNDLPAHGPKERALAAALKEAGEKGDTEAFRKAEAVLAQSTPKPAPRKRA